MYRLIFILCILERSFTKIMGQGDVKINIEFDPKLPSTQYIFDPSEVNMIWHYKINGTSGSLSVFVYAEINGKFIQAISFVGNRTFVSADNRYKGRVTGWRNVSFASITIKNLTSEDYTKYKIRLDYISLTQNVENFRDVVKGEKPTRPTITCGREEVSMINVKEGDDLECSCSSKGTPAPTVGWEFSGIKFIKSNGSVLTKKKISRDEATLFTCVSRNSYGFQNKSVLDVQVQYGPSAPNITSTSLSSFVGQTVTFNCTSDGVPTPEYFWKTPDNQTKLSTGSGTLVVELRSSRQFGDYSCIASNLHGNTTSRVSLQQLFVPGKVQGIVSKETKAFQITLEWSAPMENGGSAILTYFINVSRGENVVYITETTNHQYTIDKLERSTTYTFCLWAKNVVGNGTESCVPLTTLYEGRPSIPGIPKLKLKDGALLVSWDEVAGNPTSYFVEIKVDDQNWSLSAKQGITKRLFEMSSISSGERYSVRIIAGNSYGSVTGRVAVLVVPTSKPALPTTEILKPAKNTDISTNEPEAGETSEGGVPSSIIIISVLLVLFVIVAVIFLVLWLKRRSAGRNRSRDEVPVEHVAGPLGDLYAVVESRKGTNKKEKKDLVYAELSDFEPNSSSKPKPHNTEYADIAHIIPAQSRQNSDYEEIPLQSSDEGDYATIPEPKRPNSMNV